MLAGVDFDGRAVDLLGDRFAVELGGCASPKPEPLTAAHPIVDFVVRESPRGELARRDLPERIVRADAPANISTRRH